jgi:phage I-like protein
MCESAFFLCLLHRCFAALSRQLNSEPKQVSLLSEDGYIQALPDGDLAAVDGEPLDVKAANG